MIDFILIGILVLAIGGALYYIRSQKKKGAKCIGCSCGSCCEGTCKD